jgi:hypothetical protein
MNPCSHRRNPTRAATDKTDRMAGDPNRFTEGNEGNKETERSKPGDWPSFPSVQTAPGSVVGGFEESALSTAD